LSLLVAINGFTQRAIDTSEYIQIGGIKQYISVKGADNTNPVLLFLCGGPGSSVMDVADKFTGKLQKSFVVVEWDQRETGKTLQLNSSPQPLTVSLMQRDTKELIDSLLVQFRQNKLYLMAHSWGTTLGLYIAGKYPELFDAYIAISPMVNQLQSEQMTLSMLKSKAEKEGNKTEVEELSKVQILFANWEQMYFARKWLFSFNGQSIGDSDTAAVKGYVAGWVDLAVRLE